MAFESRSVKAIGKLCEGKPHAQFDEGALETERWRELYGHKIGNDRYRQVQTCTSPRQCSTLLIICCRYEEDAIRVREALGKRLARFKLRLNEDKTRMISFSKKRSKQGDKQETFDFLGFTFYLGKSLQGNVIPKLKTSGRRLRTKLKRVNEWARQIRNKGSLRDIWKTFCAKLRGHVQYYGVSFNSGEVQKFLRLSEEIIFKWLNRRSQRKSFSWEKFKEFTKRFPLPDARIHHKLF